MFLGLVLVVPAIRNIRVRPVQEHQARPRHAESLEIGISHIAHVNSQPLRGAAMFDSELQQDQAFARVAEARARLEVDVQLLVRLNEPEVGEAGRMRQAHARRYLFPARIICQILIGAILVGKDRVRAIGRQWPIQVILDRSVQLQFALIHQLHHRVREDRLGD